MQILDIDTSDEALQAEMLGNLLYDIYLPRKVVDVGCNTGLYLAPFLARGCEVMGYDNNPKSPTVPVRNRDITKPFRDHADLTICLEVLEHIPDEYSDAVLDNLVKISDKLIFTAAQPGAGGVGHINCQPKEYWRQKIESRGFEFCPGETAFITERMNKPGVMGWLLNNLMVFRRGIKYPFYHNSLNHNQASDVTAVVTSCGRFDLLKRTLDSFHDSVNRIIISDDSQDTYQHDLIINHFKNYCDIAIHGKNRGQAANLDSLYDMVTTPYIFHMEDDWEFLYPGSVRESREIMKDASIGLVQLDIRPAYFKAKAVGDEAHDYFEYRPWRISDDHVLWHGWCGSPHLLRKSTWEKLGRFTVTPNETAYDALYGASGLRTVWMKKPFVRHIGYGRSTMGNYEWLK